MNDELRKAAQDALDAMNALIHQIDINDFEDSHGHLIKNFKALHDCMKEIKALRAALANQPELGRVECETCARKRERLLKSGFLKSPLRDATPTTEESSVVATLKDAAMQEQK